MPTKSKRATITENSPTAAIVSSESKMKVCVASKIVPATPKTSQNLDSSISSMKSMVDMLPDFDSDNDTIPKNQEHIANKHTCCALCQRQLRKKNSREMEKFVMVSEIVNILKKKKGSQSTNATSIQTIKTVDELTVFEDNLKKEDYFNNIAQRLDAEIDSEDANSRMLDLLCTYARPRA